MKIVGLQGIKKHSSRLYAKGWRDFAGKPMWKWNVEKGLKYFNEFYVYCDDEEILRECEKMGAIGIKEAKYSPNNITWYNIAYKSMGNPDVIVALQTNSPGLEEDKIKLVIQLMKDGIQEVKTCHTDKTDYGDVWALTKERLFNYANSYHAKPDVWVLSESVDIHTIDDLQKELSNFEYEK